MQVKPVHIIRRAYGPSTNFMTPEIEGYGWIEPRVLAYELSKGESIFDRHRTIWGVTVAHATEGRKKDLSKGGFESRLEAMAYIDSLRKGL